MLSIGAQHLLRDNRPDLIMKCRTVEVTMYFYDVCAKMISAKAIPGMLQISVPSCRRNKNGSEIPGTAWANEQMLTSGLDRFELSVCSIIIERNYLGNFVLNSMSFFNHTLSLFLSLCDVCTFLLLQKPAAASAKIPLNNIKRWPPELQYINITLTRTKKKKWVCILRIFVENHRV